ERGEERRLAALFDAPAPAPDGGRPAIQAAFCIDVRSEVYRRALEQADEGIATIGFAGFFGLPLSHRRAGSDSVEARAPVLLKPALDTSARPADDCDRRIRARATRAWGRFKMAAVSAFAFVEAAGPLYAAKLVRDSRARPRRARLDPAPTLDLPLTERIAAARTVLGAMSLTRGFARLVLLAGHGAEVTNAPHASALQCGACGGHAGDVNARALAGLLNDGEVRAGLAEAGIVIPEDTLFVAGLHDTVSDEMTLFDDAPAPGHGPDLDRLRGALARAGRLARTERALSLPRAGGEASLAARGGDWSDLRPEWGLAGCSAFIAAPRHRSRGRDLAGRAFLHSYDWQADEGFATLELILTAPVVVASWISLQYYGSTVAPEAFGAGNKLLHNVTGGIGVVEGNGGLLRAGLPMQSVHDGSAFRHEALRLSVVIEAPTEAISGVLEKHPELAALFDNGWLSLSAMDAAGRIAWRYEAGGWQASGAGAAAVQAA
uniref:putative inorganic carbon transporter subunit DabA n=1 Tax=Nioella sp. TaxID=1912091 RepID=UPI0035151BA5